jgi:CubicO group peptidase (beta-lactamase class C family)
MVEIQGGYSMERIAGPDASAAATSKELNLSASPSDHEKFSARIAGTRAIMQASVDTGDTPGIVSLIWHRGEVVQTQAVGRRDIEHQLPMERSTIFAIASMSKPVTVVAALTLIEQGKMRLEDRITRWAPEFADMRVLKRPDAALDDTYPAHRDITIDDLMTHRSGLSYGFLGSSPLSNALMEKIGFGIESSLSADEWMKNLGSLPLAYAPGERFNYGLSIDVLGIIIGRVAESSLREALQTQVCGPLDMQDTDFWIPPAKRARAATIYNAGIDLKRFTPTQISTFIGATPQAFASGGQGLVSTVDDYLTFARMLMNGGEVKGRRLLKPETVQLMTTDRLTAAQRQIPSIVCAPWSAVGFGLGLSMITNPEDYAATGWGVGSDGAFGWAGMFGGWWQADPKRDLILVWLVEATPPPPAPNTMPRFPGALANRQFQKLVYAALRQ